MSFSLSFSSRVFLFRFEPQSLSLVLTDPSFLSLSIRSSLLRTSTCSLSLAFMPGLSFFPLFASYFSTPPRGFVPVLLRVPFSQPFSLPPFTRNSLSVPVRRRVSPFLSAPRSAPFTNGSVSVCMGATRRRGGARSSSLRLVLVRVLFPFRFSVFPSRSHRSTPRPTFVFSDGRVAVASPRRPLERRSIEADALSSNHAAPSQPNSANFRGSRPSIR